MIHSSKRRSNLYVIWMRILVRSKQKERWRKKKKKILIFKSLLHPGVDLHPSFLRLPEFSLPLLSLSFFFSPSFFSFFLSLLLPFSSFSPSRKLWYLIIGCHTKRDSRKKFWFSPLFLFLSFLSSFFLSTLFIAMISILTTLSLLLYIDCFLSHFFFFIFLSSFLLLLSYFLSSSS